MIKGTFLAWLGLIVCMIFTIATLSNGLSNSWIGLVIAILILGFFLSKNDETEDKLKSLTDDWQDYKEKYEPPNEYNIPDMISQEDIDETIDSMNK